MKDYLQHYGVKGMKWGVRKEEENTSGRMFNGVTGTLDNDSLSRTYNAFNTLAKQKFQSVEYKLNKLTLATGIHVINDLRGDARDNLWKTCYKDAANQLANGQFSSDDVLAIMAVYKQFDDSGLSKDFTIEINGSNGKATSVVITHRQTGRKFSSISSALSFKKQYNSSRKRAVQGKPVAVKVNKSKKISGGPVGSNQGAKSMLNNASKDKRSKQAQNAVSKVGSATIKSVNKTLKKK